MVQVFIFGASITHGCWDNLGGWPLRLRNYLQERKPKEHFVYPLGIPVDESSKELLKRIKNELDARKDNSEKNIIFISIGANDSEVLINQNKHRTPKDKFRENIHKLIEISKKYSREIYFIEQFPFDEKKLNPIPWCPKRAYRLKDLNDYNIIIKEECKKASVNFIKTFNKLENKEFLETLEDGIHPNSKGHELIFNIMKEYADKCLLKK